MKRPVTEIDVRTTPRAWIGFVGLIGLGILLPVALVFIVLTQSACGC
jgi:hypothetical protein